MWRGAARDRLQLDARGAVEEALSSTGDEWVAAAVGEGSIAVRLVHDLFESERLGSPVA